MHGPMRDRIAAVISLAVVLPLLPPTATTGTENCARHAWPSCCRARSASATTICGSGMRHRALDHGADGAARRGRRDELPRRRNSVRAARRTAPRAASVRLSVATAP